MKLSKTGRRMFLTGAGATLAIPLLPSLVPGLDRRAHAAGAPVRYLQLFNMYGPSAALWFGQRTPDLTPQTNVRAQSFADVDGNISPIFGAEFNPFKSRMSLLRGVDTLIRNANHHCCFSTCASSYDGGLDGDMFPPSSGQPSVDTVIATSPKTYGDETPIVRRQVILNPANTDDYSGSRSFCWQGEGDTLEMIRPVKETDAFFEAFANGFNLPTAPIDGRDDALVDQVYADYARVKASPRISSADKQKLEGYMALIADLKKGAGVCTPPEVGEQPDIEAEYDNQFRILVAAMACDMTRVGSIMMGMSEGYGSRHDQHHGLFGKTESPIIDDFKRFSNRLARLMTMMDAVDEGTGSMLDNALLYWSMQYGCVVVDGQHNNKDMACFVGGGAGGLLNQGHYIDYRKESAPEDGGVAINNLLVTFMNCMGLSSGDYEPSGGTGYGDYPDGALDNRPDGSFWNSTDGRRSALPFLYEGPALG